MDALLLGLGGGTTLTSNVLVGGNIELQTGDTLQFDGDLLGASLADFRAKLESFSATTWTPVTLVFNHNQIKVAEASGAEGWRKENGFEGLGIKESTLGTRVSVTTNTVKTVTVRRMVSIMNLE